MHLISRCQTLIKIIFIFSFLFLYSNLFLIMIVTKSHGEKMSSDSKIGIKAYTEWSKIYGKSKMQHLIRQQKSSLINILYFYNY